MIPHKYRRIIPAVLLALPLSVNAAEWYVEPAVTLRTGFSDNIRLTSAPHDSVWRASASPSVSFGVAKEHQRLTGNAGFTIHRFTGGSGPESSSLLNREDYDLGISARHNTPLSSYSLDLDYLRDSTLDSELTQTGNVSERATRENLSFAPSWSRRLTELTSIELSYQFNDVGYSDDPGIPDLVAYNYHTASVLLTRILTPRVEAKLSAGVSRFLPDTDFNSDTVSLQAGLKVNFSQTLVASFLAGQRDTTSDSFFGTGICLGADPGATFPTCSGGIPIPTGRTNTEIETSSSVFTASIAKTFEAASLSALLSRSSSPSSDGELLDATRLVLSGNYEFSEKLESILKVEYSENETIVSRIGITPDQGKDKFFRVTPIIKWHWQRDWIIRGEYLYATNKDAAGPNANQNTVLISVTYKPPKRSISR